MLSGQKIFMCSKKIWSKKFLSQKNIWVNILVKKKFGLKFLVQKNFGLKKIIGKRIFLTKVVFGQKIV